jgi:hypothetical protein
MSTLRTLLWTLPCIRRKLDMVFFETMPIRLCVTAANHTRIVVHLADPEHDDASFMLKLFSSSGAPCRRFRRVGIADALELLCALGFDQPSCHISVEITTQGMQDEAISQYVFASLTSTNISNVTVNVN